MTPFDFTRGVRNLNRLQKVVRVMTQHGFGYVVNQMRLGRLVPVWMRGHPQPINRMDSEASLGRRMASVCTELGPTFTKLGQMLSTRPDLLPKAILDELRLLQEEVPPFDSDTARKIIAEELGRPIDECFQSMDPEPLASGSIGQVYEATTRSGRRVVIKVRRPGIESTIRADLQLLRWLSETAEHFLPELRIYRPTIIVQEFEQMLEREMDYVHEASLTSAMGEAFKNQPDVRIPRVFWDLSTARVLTLEALDGRSLSELMDAQDPAAGEVDRRQVAKRLLSIYLDQILEIGLLHADPHPGNILIDPPATIGLIDFGQTAAISEDMVTQLVIILYGAIRREPGMVFDALADLEVVGVNCNRRELERALRSLFDKYYGLPIKRFDFSTLVNEFTEIVRRHDVLIPREVVILMKALGMVGGVATRLDPELDMLAIVKPRLKDILRRRFSPSRLSRAAANSAYHSLTMLRTMPGMLRDGLRRFASGTWQLNVQHENIDRLSTELDRSSNRLAVAVVMAALIVGSSVIISTEADLTFLDIPVKTVGIIGYLVAAILGLGLSWAIFRSGRLH